MFQSKRRLGRYGSTKASGEPDASSSPGSPSSATAGSSVPANSSKGQPNGSNNGVAHSEYAKRCKALMELYLALLSLGTDMFDIELPKITVIGAQSAGKSSLIEVVSGISVPRDSGICTRCPVEISMVSFVREWKCTIDLRIEHDPNGNKKETSDLIQFCELSSKEKRSVDLWLRRAQASILSRERPESDFQNMSMEELRRLKPGEGSMLPFSMNVIQVRLYDPEATDLTFIDLPGLIQNASDEDVSIAHRLVKKNIEGTTTLILVTIPMSGAYMYISGAPDEANSIKDEMENQEAAKLARKTDPSGDRTIGVLTKPDTITRGAIGSRQRWKDVLQGRSHTLRHGYYCVRLADDDERAKRLTRAESEVISANFFANTEPWNNFDDRSRFGISNFVKDISRLLLSMIESNLPKLKGTVDQLISKYSDELRSMPSLPTREPSTEILLRVSDFSRELICAVMGTEDKFLVQNNRAHYTAFKRAIERTEPDFWPFTSKENYRSPGLHAGAGDVGPFDLEDVRREIANATGWELGGIIPPDVIKNIVSKSTSIWKSSAVGCFDSVFQTTSSAIEVLVARHFKQFTKLETLIKTISYEKLDECKAKAIDLIEKLLQHEMLPLYTQNCAYEAGRKSWLQRYTDVHRNHLNYLTPLGHYVSTAYDDELQVMAIVSAYFHVASERFVDQIPLAIEHQLNQFFAKNIEQAVVENVMSGSEITERMKDLLSEDEGMARRRQALEKKLTRLREIREKLFQFELTSNF